MSTDPEIHLGATYRDIATGFEGIAQSATRFLFACERVWLVKGHNEKGEEIGAAFDANGLVLVEPAKNELLKAIRRAHGAVEARDERAAARSGGVQPTPSAQRDDAPLRR